MPPSYARTALSWAWSRPINPGPAALKTKGAPVDFAIARRNMVDSQVLPNRVTDERLIAAMGSIPREAFVPPEKQGIAYADQAIPLGGGRYLMEPMITARLIQAAAPAAGDLALVIGCNTGYGAAVLSHMVSTVVGVESDPGFAQQAAQILAGLGIDTVAVIEGELAAGCPDQAPFNVILFDGAVEEIPDAVSSQLAEGGRLAAVVSDDGLGRGTVITRHRNGFSRHELFDAGTPRLPGFEPKETFVF